MTDPAMNEHVRRGLAELSERDRLQREASNAAAMDGARRQMRAAHEQRERERRALAELRK